MPILGAMSPTLAPTTKPSMLDIAWAAGIYEGEGWCSSPRRTDFQMAVCQKDRWLCAKMRALFGGSVHPKHGYNAWWWRLSGPRARGFAYTIFTFLSPRRRAQIRKAVYR
jgi:hypothetical protein